MDPLDFVPPEMMEEPVQSRQTVKLTPGVRRAMRMGWIYIDPADGLTPTAWYKTLVFGATVLDMILCIMIEVLLGVGIGLLAAVTPLGHLVPNSISALGPLWQLGGFAALLGGLLRPKIVAGFFTPSLKSYTMEMLTDDA